MGCRGRRYGPIPALSGGACWHRGCHDGLHDIPLRQGWILTTASDRRAENRRRHYQWSGLGPAVVHRCFNPQILSRNGRNSNKAWGLISIPRRKRQLLLGAPPPPLRFGNDRAIRGCVDCGLGREGAGLQPPHTAAHARPNTPDRTHLHHVPPTEAEDPPQPPHVGSAEAPTPGPSADDVRQKHLPAET